MKIFLPEFIHRKGEAMTPPLNIDRKRGLIVTPKRGIVAAEEPGCANAADRKDNASIAFIPLQGDMLDIVF